MPVKGFVGERCKVVCPCGKIIFVVKSKKDTKKYCSKACYSKYYVSPHKGRIYSYTYSAVHYWIRKNKQLPGKCEKCGRDDVKLQWANKSHEYKIDVDDWMGLCLKCHRKHDLDEAGMKRNDGDKFPDILKYKKPSGNRKLTKEQVIDIFLSEDHQKKICEKYNLSSGYVCFIKSGRFYKKYTKNLIKPKVRPMYIKLRESDVIDILKSDLPATEIANKYGMATSCIYSIRKGQTWKKIFDKFYST